MTKKSFSNPPGNRVKQYRPDVLTSTDDQPNNAQRLASHTISSSTQETRRRLEPSLNISTPLHRTGRVPRFRVPIRQTARNYQRPHPAAVYHHPFRTFAQPVSLAVTTGYGRRGANRHRPRLLLQSDRYAANTKPFLLHKRAAVLTQRDSRQHLLPSRSHRNNCAVSGTFGACHSDQQQLNQPETQRVNEPICFQQRTNPCYQPLLGYSDITLEVDKGNKNLQAKFAR